MVTIVKIEERYISEINSSKKTRSLRHITWTLSVVICTLSSTLESLFGLVLEDCANIYIHMHTLLTADTKIDVIHITCFPISLTMCKRLQITTLAQQVGDGERTRFHNLGLGGRCAIYCTILLGPVVLAWPGLVCDIKHSPGCSHVNNHPHARLWIHDRYATEHGQSR
jgi:hypothetical protein